MSSVIRRETVTSSPAFSFADVEREAERVLAAAREQARQIVAAAEQRAHQADGASRESGEEQRRAGYARGLEEGRREGQEQVRRETRQEAVETARDELQHVIGALRSGLAEFERQKRALLGLAEGGLIDLSLAIAERVCKIVVGRSSEAARANARALLEMVAHHDDVRICMHPDDCAPLEDVAGELVGAVGELQHVRIEPDEQVERGGCVLRWRGGTIDARIAEQLQRIAESIALEREDVGASECERPDGAES